MTAVDTALGFAKEQLGEPYRWAATGPDRWDCSGLTQAACRAAGVSIPRTSITQYAAGPKVSLSSLLPGDLVFMGRSALLVHHVAMYVGNGTVIHAPHSGDVVKYSHLAGFTDVLGATRPLSGGSSGAGAVQAPTAQQAGFSIPNPLGSIPNPLDLPGEAAKQVEQAITGAVSGVWADFQHAAITYGVVGAGVALAGLGLYRAVAARSTGES